MLRNLERISRENYEIFVFWKMPKTLDITRILREQKELLRAGFQDRLTTFAARRDHAPYEYVFFMAGAAVKKSVPVYFSITAVLCQVNRASF